MLKSEVRTEFRVLIIISYWSKIFYHPNFRYLTHHRVLGTPYSLIAMKWCVLFSTFQIIIYIAIIEQCSLCIWLPGVNIIPNPLKVRILYLFSETRKPCKLLQVEMRNELKKTTMSKQFTRILKREWHMTKTRSPGFQLKYVWTLIWAKRQIWRRDDDENEYVKTHQIMGWSEGQVNGHIRWT